MAQLVPYLAFVAAALLAPGLALLRLAGLPLDPALVLPLGIAAAAGAYWLSLWTGWAPVFPLLIVALMASGLVFGRGPWRRAPGPSVRGALPAMTAVIALLAVTQFGGNRPGPDGSFLLDPFVAFDTAFHVGLTRELTLGYPPQVPGVAGFPLGYHLGPDLVRAAALRWASVDPYDSIARLDVTLGALALVLALRAAASALGGGRLATDLAGFSVLFTDFSFVFAANPQAHWWADLLRGNLLISLALSNPVVPALAMALGALVALGRATAEGGHRGWLIAAALLAGSVPFFKVFLGAHLLLGLGLAALLARRERAKALLAGLPCAAATAALALGQGSRTVAVAIDPLDLVHTTRETLGLEALQGPALAAWALLWLAASLGGRLLGLPDAVRALARGTLAARAMAAMALFAWPLGLLFRVSAPEMLPGQRFVNDAAYLLEQGGPILWLFAALALERMAGPRAVTRGAGLLALAVLTLPSTLQFAVKKARQAPDPIPAAMVRAARALQDATVPGDVVLQRPAARYPPVPVVLAGRRVPYERFTPWLTQFAAPEDLRRRHEQVYRFFRTTDAAEARTIADSLNARVVCLYGPDRVRFPAEGTLEWFFEEPGARCARMAGPVR